MKKNHTGLVDLLNIIATLTFLIGAVGVLFAVLGSNGALALALGASVILTTLILYAIATVIDLLATIEVNTRIAATYFEKRIPSPDKTGQ